MEKQQEELSAYVDERESRRGDPEEEGSTRALRASAGYRATDERDQARMDIYLPLQADGCVRCAVRMLGTQRHAAGVTLLARGWEPPEALVWALQCAALH